MAQSSAGIALPKWFREVWGDVFREAGTEKGTEHYIDGKTAKYARVLCGYWKSEQKQVILVQSAVQLWPYTLNLRAFECGIPRKGGWWHYQCYRIPSWPLAAGCGVD